MCSLYLRLTFESSDVLLLTKTSLNYYQSERLNSVALTKSASVHLISAGQLSAKWHK